MNKHDIKIYEEFILVLPTNGSINFISTHNMSDHFHIDKMKDLGNFHYKWKGKDKSFSDKELDKSLSLLKKNIAVFLSNIAINTFPTGSDGYFSINSDLEIANPKLFNEVLDKLHQSANNVCTSRDELIMLYKDKIGKSCISDCQISLWAIGFKDWKNGLAVVSSALVIAGIGFSSSNIEILREYARLPSIRKLQEEIKSFEIDNKNLNKMISNYTAREQALEEENQSLQDELKKYVVNNTKNAERDKYLQSLSEKLPEYISDYNKISEYDKEIGIYSYAEGKLDHYDKVRNAKRLREVIYSVALELNLKDIQKAFAP